MARPPLRALLVGPGASRAEELLTAGAAAAGAVVAVVLSRGQHGWTWWLVALTALLGLDLFGGVVANATGAARRWWHRPGTRDRDRVLFALGHVHPYVLAAVTDLPWVTAAALHACAVGGALLVAACGADLRRPLAYGCTALALAVLLGAGGVPAGLAWFAVAYLVKLLMAHLLPDGRER
ncbi:hypothetical protein [Kineococcus sp. SYSU DK003]|uniref:hypothetical protein n=1 Tax=Kineococcus sp. SYSU DK003 TaxID=3383124 RepID=UPI003D7D1BFA